MSVRVVNNFTFGLLLACGASSLNAARQEVTPAPEGPFRVEGNRILDSRDRPFRIRGTQLTVFRPQTAAYNNRAGVDFGGHSATSLSAIRLRFNMNAVRLPVSAADSGRPDFFRELANVVRRANDIELLVILAAAEPGATVQFWSRAATRFWNYPNVMFSVGDDPAGERVRAIRAAGARQLVAVRSEIDAVNVFYEVSTQYRDIQFGAQRDALFGALAQRAPVLASGLDLQLDDAAECALIPFDPGAATRLVQENLEYFDARGISYSVSVFEPGKLIRDLSLHDATSLENGWTCGPQGYPAPGLGRVVQAHLRASEERGLFVVSAAGGVDLPRGGFANGYGPVMAERDARGFGPRLPKSLAGLTVEVKDAVGVKRQAGIIWATAGWGQFNVVIPAESAVGPGSLTLVRKDGSASAVNITIADTVPGFRTGLSCRGPAIGTAVQVFAGGRTSAESPVSFCKGYDCRTFPVPMTSGAVTRVRLVGSGFRYAASASKIVVTVGGERVPVISYGPGEEPGMDQLTIEIPARLRGLGETDLFAYVAGRVSNPVRILIGGDKPAS